MKKIISIATVLLIAIGTFAQTNEGRVKYNIDFNSSDPQMQAQFAMLKGSTLNMFFTPEFNRVEMNMGMFMTNKTIVDIAKKETVVIMDGMMGKKAIKTTAETTPEEPAFEGEVEVTTETKKIAGYKCVKTIITLEDGSVVNYWTTEELTASTEGNRFANKKVKGFPLEFEVAAQGMTMTFTAIEVEKGLKKYNKKDLFTTEIPAGYEIMTEEELQRMSGGM